MAEEAQHIASFMWGKGIKKGLIQNDEIHNYDFAPTMAKLLGINAPLDSTGKVLYNVLDNIFPSLEYDMKFEDDEAVVSENVERSMDGQASGGTAISLYDNLAWVEFTNLPAAEKIIVKYTATVDGKLSLYVNDKFVRDIFFPSTYRSGTYDDKMINITIRNGDMVKFLNDATHNCSGINIDYIVLSGDYNDETINEPNTTFLLKP